jgi:S-methylmethionine-dependent homocysteine/selenocysteine methylase
VLLDGDLPTELRSARLAVDAPWWTNRALLTGHGRALIRSIHEAHLAAGADILTTATFHCARETLLGLGLAPGSGTAWMVHAAVGVARAAAGSRPGVTIAGSVGPLPRPDREHEWLVTELARSGVDVVLAGPMPSVTEAAAVVDVAVAAHTPVWISLHCKENGRLPSREPLAEAVLALRERGAALVILGCGRPEHIGAALQTVRARYTGPLGVRPDALGDPETMAYQCDRWRTAYDLDLVGGCCGTTARHLRAIVTAQSATGS